MSWPGLRSANVFLGGGFFMGAKMPAGGGLGGWWLEKLFCLWRLGWMRGKQLALRHGLLYALACNVEVLALALDANELAAQLLRCYSGGATAHKRV